MIFLNLYSSYPSFDNQQQHVQSPYENKLHVQAFFKEKKPCTFHQE